MLLKLVLRIKDRFHNPTVGGWRDCLINVRFVDDPHSVVCELQLVHVKMMLIRKNLSGHADYVAYRTALELQEAVSSIVEFSPGDSFRRIADLACANAASPIPPADWALWDAQRSSAGEDGSDEVVSLALPNQNQNPNSNSNSSSSSQPGEHKQGPRQDLSVGMGIDNGAATTHATTTLTASMESKAGKTSCGGSESSSKSSSSCSSSSSRSNSSSSCSSRNNKSTSHSSTSTSTLRSSSESTSAKNESTTANKGATETLEAGEDHK